jgi:hypothetical protein
METNKMSEARQLTFAEFPSKWVWNKKLTNWTQKIKEDQLE